MKNIRRFIHVLIASVLFITLLSYIANFIVFTEQPVSLVHFSFVHFSGYLFFLLMPVEALFAYFLTLGTNALILIPIAVGTALLAQYVDYVIGLLFSGLIIGKFISEKRFKRYNKIIHNWGGPSILIFNLLPLSSPILLLVAGIVRYNMKKAFTYSLIGLTIKYSFIAMVF
ncbi:hypothetical protein ACFLZ7_04125 [Nanoarchaeota archaeon]